MAVSPVSPTTRVCAACASSSSWAWSADATDGSARPSSATHSAVWRATSQLTGPVGLEDAHDLAQVDLREVEVGRVEIAGAGGPPGPARVRRARRTGRAGGRARPIRRAVRRAPRGLQVETGRPRGQCMGVHSVAVTGASGLVGRHLLPVLAAHPDVERVLGLDVREPERRPRTVEFARVDIAGTELKPLLEGIDVVVHLAGVVDPVPDVALMARVNVEGTRHVLDAGRVGRCPAGGADLERDGLRRVGQQPAPAHGGRRAPAQSRLLARGAGRRGGATAGRVAGQPPRGHGHDLALRARGRARAPNASRPASSSGARRCGCGVPTRRCRWCTSTISPSALALAATQRPPRRLQRRCRRLARRRRGPRAHRAVRRRRRSRPRCSTRWLRRTWDLGIGDVPPGVVPYLVHPWVIANDRLQAEGWAPRHSNAEAIAEAVASLPPRNATPLVAGAGGLLLVAAPRSR